MSRQTVVWLDEYHDYIVEQQRITAFNEFNRLLRNRPPTAKADFLDAASSLSAWLKSQDKDLTVVLLPLRHALTDNGKLAAKPGIAARTMVATEDALKARNIKVVNLLSDVYQAYQRATDAGVFADQSGHYTEENCEKVVKVLNVRPDSYFVGDCFAQIFAGAYEKATAQKMRYSWVNGMSHCAAYNLSSYGPSELRKVKHVVWFISDYYLIDATKFPLCVDKASAPSHLRQSSSCVATLVENSKVKPDLATTSPYTDALVVNKFKDRDGKLFLGITPVMEKRLVNEPVRIWSDANTFNLVIEDWDSACLANNELRRIQQIDSIQDYTLPRYFIHQWAHTSN